MKIIRLAENVFVSHPYEPIRCKHVSADIIAFYYDLKPNDFYMWETIARLFCKKCYSHVYIDQYIDSRCLIAYRYHDKSLFCAHDIYKPFFEYFNCVQIYNDIFIDLL